MTAPKRAPSEPPSADLRHLLDVGSPLTQSEKNSLRVVLVTIDAYERLRAQPAAGEVTRADRAAAKRLMLSRVSYDDAEAIAGHFARHRTAHAQPGSVLDKPLEWRDYKVWLGATVGPYDAQIERRPDDGVEWFAFVSGSDESFAHGKCTSLEDADEQVRAAIRKHLSESGLVHAQGLDAVLGRLRELVRAKKLHAMRIVVNADGAYVFSTHGDSIAAHQTIFAGHATDSEQSPDAALRKAFPKEWP